MVIRLFLIRHGETENGDIKRYKGHTDVPLSENGIKHMEQLSKYIVQTIQNTPHPSPLPWGERDGVRGSGLNAIYTSDLSRAVKSAEIIAKPHGLKPMIMPELRERSFGIWEGLSFDEIKEKYPEEFDAWTGNPLKFSPMQGESTIEIKDRVIRALDKILNSDYSLRIQGFKGSSEKINNLLESSNPRTLEPFSAVNIAIVSHGGINRIILCHLLGIPLENIFRIEQDYSALNVIEFYDKYPVVKLLNGGFELK